MIGLEGIRVRCNGQDVDVIGNNYIIVSLPSFHLQTCLFMLKSLNATNLCRKKPLWIKLAALRFPSMFL